MLPNYFLPEVDELPFSWTNRLALANGFKDTNDMLQSLGFIKGKAVKRQHDYLLKITKLMPKNDWTITLMKMYLAEDLQQERLIPELNEEEHLYLCPCCMQEDIKTHGAVVYHYQHQYPGAFTCWKHGVNLRSEVSVKLPNVSTETTSVCSELITYATFKVQAIYLKWMK